jgi:hypothetical protein
MHHLSERENIGLYKAPSALKDVAKEAPALNTRLFGKNPIGKSGVPLSRFFVIILKELSVVRIFPNIRHIITFFWKQ